MLKWQSEILSEDPCDAVKDFCLPCLSSAWQHATPEPTFPQHTALLPPAKERRRLKPKRRLVAIRRPCTGGGGRHRQLRRFSWSAGHCQVDRQNSRYRF